MLVSVSCLALFTSVYALPSGGRAVPGGAGQPSGFI